MGGKGREGGARAKPGNQLVLHIYIYMHEHTCTLVKLSPYNISYCLGLDRTLCMT